MIDAAITPRMADLGHGLVVRRVLACAARRAVGPFVFFHHVGPVQLAPENARQTDARPHPHIAWALSATCSAAPSPTATAWA